MKLGRFDHHPDPAIDYCVEVECIEGMTWDAAHGLPVDKAELDRRIFKAMQFRVGGDLNAISAKTTLRECEAKFNALKTT